MKRDRTGDDYNWKTNSMMEVEDDVNVDTVQETTRRETTRREKKKRPKRSLRRQWTTNEAATTTTGTRSIIVMMKSFACFMMMMLVILVMARRGRIGRRSNLVVETMTNAFQVEMPSIRRAFRPWKRRRRQNTRTYPVNLHRYHRIPKTELSIVSGYDGNSENNEDDDGKQRRRRQRVVVVGGGVGGLAVASRIAAASQSRQDDDDDDDDDSSVSGVDITILEKNPQIGGRCGSFWVEAPTNVEENDSTRNRVGRYRHERGPSLLLLPHVYKQIFEESTTTMMDVKNSNARCRDAAYYGLDMVQCVPAYQVVFDDGDRIEVGFPTTQQEVETTTTTIADREATSRAKMDSYEEDGAKKWDDYLRITQAYLDCGLPNFIEERLDLISFPNFVWEGVIRDFAKAWPLQPHSDLLDSLFTSTKLKALASFQDLYVGLEPYRNNELLGGGVLRSTAPAVFGLLAAIELHPTNKKAGVFAPIGGFQAVTNSLEELASDLDINIQCSTTVVGINESGVYTKETASPDSTFEFVPADLVVVNADLPYAKESLLIKDDDNDVETNHHQSDGLYLEEKFDWDDTFSFSSGVVSFHWSIAGKVLEDLNTHNVFLCAGSPSDAIASWDVLRYTSNDKPGGGNSLQNDIPFNFYVHRPTVCDPSAAPKGCDSIMVLVPCKTLLRDEECSKLPRDEAMKIYKAQFSEEFISATRQAVLDRMKCVESLHNFDKHIIDEVVDTPATWAEQFHLAAGTPFALSHGFAQLSLTRPGPSSSGMPNVLYCGASTRPGNGVPLVLIGAKQVAQKAVAKLFQR